MIKLFFITLAILGIGGAFMAIRLFFIKDGEFVNSHVGSNPNMKKKNIGCAKSIDKLHRKCPTPEATRSSCSGCGGSFADE